MSPGHGMWFDPGCGRAGAEYRVDGGVPDRRVRVQGEEPVQREGEPARVGRAVRALLFLMLMSVLYVVVVLVVAVLILVAVEMAAVAVPLWFWIARFAVAQMYALLPSRRRRARLSGHLRLIKTNALSLPPTRPPPRRFCTLARCGCTERVLRASPLRRGARRPGLRREKRRNRRPRAGARTTGWRAREFEQRRERRRRR